MSLVQCPPTRYTLRSIFHWLLSSTVDGPTVVCACLCAWGVRALAQVT